MDLYPLDPLGLHRPGPVDRGWARSLYRGPRTVEQVLEAARAAMDERDEAERQAADPVGYVRAFRARRTLFGRLFYGRSR